MKIFSGNCDLDTENKACTDFLFISKSTNTALVFLFAKLFQKTEAGEKRLSEYPEDIPPRVCSRFLRKYLYSPRWKRARMAAI